MKRTRCFAFCLMSLAVFAPSAWAVSGSEVDNFSSTLENWTQGGSPALTRVTTGGPAGVGDAFLEMTADGAGPQGRLITFNRTQWTGDYVTAGVSSIAVDFKSFGGTLNMRLAFKSGTGIGDPGYVTDAFVVPEDGAWHHAVFSLDEGSLTAIGGPAALSTFLGSVAEMRILNASSASLLGDVITSTVGIDNVAVVPEPASLCVLGIGALGLLRRRR